MKRKHRRIKRRGYAGGGPVTASNYGVASDTSAETSQMAPVYMSVTLDNRSHNPEHFSEDYAPNETMPDGAPEVPEGAGYARGGVVRGYDDGGEVDDDDDYEEEDAPEAEEDDDEGPAEGAPPVRPQGPPRQPAGEEEEVDPEEGGDPDQMEARGDQVPMGQEGRKPPLDTDFSARGRTGYNPEAAPEEDTGRYSDAGYGPRMPQQQNDESRVRNALAAIRQALGLNENGGPEPAPPPSYGPRTTLPAEGSILDNAAKSYQASRMDPMTEGGLPTPPMEAQRDPTQRDPANGLYQRGDFGDDPLGGLVRRGATALKNYFDGGGAMAQPQVEQALANTDKTRPGLDQAGKIGKTFNDIYAQDPKAAGEFVQAMKPSYANLRAAAMAAAGQGALVEATQLASKMNDLIPNGKSVTFTRGQNGNINAHVRDAIEGGKETAVFTMTPQQFANYLKGPASTLDGAVELGVEKALGSAGKLVTPEQQRQGPSTGYQRAMEDYKLQMQAYRAFPYQGQEGQFERLLDRLRNGGDRVNAERAKQQAITDRQNKNLDAVDRRYRDMDEARGLREVYKGINDKFKADPGYKPTPREQQIIDRVQERYSRDRNAPQPQQSAPANNSAPPSAAPAGMVWGRSRSTGEWSLRPQR